MRSAARFIGVLVVIIGAVAVVAPDRLIAIGQAILTPAGMYVIAALRIAVGLVVLGAAPASRAPTALRIVGAIIVVAGVATPFFGADRSRLIFEWWAAQGPVALRVPGLILLALGSAFTYLFGAGRRV